MIYILTTLAAFLLGLTMRSSVRYTGLRWDLQRAFIRKRDGYHCRICNKQAVYGQTWIEVHHRHSIARGGSHYPWNLELLCKPCHDEKHR